MVYAILAANAVLSTEQRPNGAILNKPSIGTPITVWKTELVAIVPPVGVYADDGLSVMNTPLLFWKSEPR